MFLLRISLQAIVLPALVCGFSFWVLHRLTGRARQSLPAAAALAAGYLTGHATTIGPPPLPPVETTQWLFVLVALSALSGLGPFQREPWRLGMVVALIAGLLGLSLKPMFVHHWEIGEAIFWCAGLFAGFLVLSYLVEWLALRDGGTILLAAFLLVSLASAAVLGLSATALLAQLSGTTAVCLGVLFAFSLRYAVSPAGWLLVGLIILTGLGLNGYFYAQVTGWNLFCLLAALPAAWVSQLRSIRDRSLWLRISITLAAVLLVTAPAVTGALIGFLDTPEYDY